MLMACRCRSIQAAASRSLRTPEGGLDRVGGPARGRATVPGLTAGDLGCWATRRRARHLKATRKSQTGRPVKMKARRTLTGQEGFTLIEILAAAIILGIAVVGLTLLLSRGQAFIVAQGDTRIALYLTEQKIERLRALGFGAAWVPNTNHLNYSDALANNGCVAAGSNNESF